MAEPGRTAVCRLTARFYGRTPAMKPNLAGLVPLYLLLACLVVAPAFAADPTDSEKAEEAASATKYIQLKRDADDEPLALQTAIVHFASTDASRPELTIDLVAAIHVADKAYYEELNKQFAGYDVVLYEMVAPADARIPKGTKPGNHPVAMLQNGLKDMLQLEHQLELVDYSAANMVHADMSPEDFSKSMKDRGENFLTMFMKMMAQAMAQEAQPKKKSKSSEIDLFSALLDKNGSGVLKRVMAEQFESMEGLLGALAGPQGSTIITERNRVALAKLGEQITAGKKKIAIFYGAGHMGDLEKHLQEDFKMRQSSTQWLDAWRLDPKVEPAPGRACPAAFAAIAAGANRPAGHVDRHFLRAAGLPSGEATARWQSPAAASWLPGITAKRRKTPRRCPVPAIRGVQIATKSLSDVRGLAGRDDEISVPVAGHFRALVEWPHAQPNP